MEDRSLEERPPEARGREGSPRAAVELQNVTKRFGEFVAVDDITLEINEGEFFSLLGPSGCGKTTTLRMIAGFEEPTEGVISVAGQQVQGVPPYKRPVNTVFQSYAIFPHLNVFDNVAFGLRRSGVRGEELRRRVTEACAMVQLEGFEKRKPSALSGGQQQRVALARALVNRPKVLLLDEPLGALDLKLRKELQLELRNLQNEVGITFVYVTHDQEEALTMSDRIAVINEGRVQQIADPTTLYELPKNRFVANFIGQTNVFSGTVETVEGPAEEERVTLRTPGGARIEARARGEARVEIGAEAQAAVRPEKVRFAEGVPQNGSALDNVVAAEIRQIVYLGVSTQYIAELEGGGRLVLYQQNAYDASGPGVGDEVRVAWDARNCLVLGG
ncbi:MAG TPA: ABC transporter ATP-binding protein [Rubrobacteraceae bacterium]|nr:ABC transporter ATP-binding protein [Rubrobacteraceae bacterium]